MHFQVTKFKIFLDKWALPIATPACSNITSRKISLSYKILSLNFKGISHAITSLQVQEVCLIILLSIIKTGFKHSSRQRGAAT